MKRMFSLLALTAGLFLSPPTSMAKGRVSLKTTTHHNGKNETKDHKHNNFWLGGSVTLWQDTEHKSTTFSFRPELGHFLSEFWGVGLLGNYTSEHDTQNYGVTPFVRYYIFERKPFNIYFDAGLGLNWIQSKLGEDWSKVQLGYEIGVRPGACLDLAKGLCLCLRMGFVGYRNKFTSGEEHDLTSNGWGIRFAPEELMIGLEIEF